MSKKKRNWIPWMEAKRQQRKEFEFMCAVCNKAIADMYTYPPKITWIGPEGLPMSFTGGNEMRSPFYYEVR